MESLVCDNFIVMMSHIGQYKEKVLRICEAYLKDFHDNMDTIKDLPPVINLTVGRFKRIASAVVALVHPIPAYMKSSAADVTDLRKYKGSEVAETTVRNLLNAKEVKAFDSDTMIPNPWNQMFDELITKGQFTLTNMPQLEALQQKLAKANTNEHVLKIDWNDLATLIKDLPPLMKGMRNGVCTEAVSQLKKIVMSIAQEMVKIKDEQTLAEHVFSQYHVGIVQQGLKLMESVPGFAKLSKELATWEQRCGGLLSKAELGIVCRSYPDDPVADPGIPNYPTMNTVARFSEAIGKCGKDFVEMFAKDGDGMSLLVKAMAWNFTTVSNFVKAGDWIWGVQI